MGGYKRRVLAGEQQWMLLRLEECPHLKVRVLAVELAERGLPVSPNTVWSLLRKTGERFKKGAILSIANTLDNGARSGLCARHEERNQIEQGNSADRHWYRVGLCSGGVLRPADSFN